VPLAPPPHLKTHALSSSESDAELEDSAEPELVSVTGSWACSFVVHFVQCTGAYCSASSPSQDSAQTANLQLTHCHPHKEKLGSESLRLWILAFCLRAKTQMSFGPPVAASVHWSGLLLEAGAGASGFGAGVGVHRKLAAMHAVSAANDART
jgi:hypothetical protein